jgi:AraC family transcriptional regulator
VDALVLLRHGEFLGREISRIRVPGFVVTFRRSGSGRKDEKPHCHGNPNLLLALDRGYWSEADGFDEGNPAQLFYTPAGTCHRDSMVRLGGRYLSISIDDRVVGNSARDLRHPVALERPLAARIAHSMALRNAQGDLSPLFVEDACLALVGELNSRARTPRPHWLEHIVELCNGCFKELPSISDIGTMIGIHPVHVSRVFRSHYGMPLSKYIVSVKIERAAAALRAGTLSVAAVAAETGFSDQSHLCKSFKSVMGVTPREYKALFA